MLLSRYLSLPGIYIFFAALRYARMRKVVPWCTYVSFISYMQDFFPIRENVTAVSHCATISQRFSGCRYRPLSARNAGPGQIKTANASIYRRSDRMCCLKCVLVARARASVCGLSLFLSSSSLVSRTTGKKERENNCIAKRKTQCIPTVTSKKEQQRASA